MAGPEIREGKIAVIGGAIMTLGFRFAGIKRTTTVYPGDTPETAEKSLREVLADPLVAIVIISSSVLQKVRDRRLRQIAEGSVFPVVLAVPDYRESATGEDTLRAIIRRAIGIDIDAIRQQQQPSQEVH